MNLLGGHFITKIIGRFLLCMLPLFSVPAWAEQLNISGCAWGANQFVMVGGDGGIITSPDGINWTYQESGINDRSLRGLAWGKDRYVAVGDNNTILSSEDGVNWTIQQSPAVEDSHLYSVEWINGGFIAVGAPGVILTSVDGHKWEQQASGTTETLTGVAWDKGYYFVVGENATLLTSYVGKSWWIVRSGMREGNFRGIISAAVARGTFLLIVGHARFGGILAKSDIAITGRDQQHDPYDRKWRFPRLLLQGNRRHLNDIVWDGVEIIVVGNDIGVSYASYWVFLNASLETVGSLQCIASNGDQLVAGGSKGILTSSYGKSNWQERGMNWQGGMPLFSNESRMQFSIPDTAIKTDPVDQNGKRNTSRRKAGNFLYESWMVLGFLVYPLLQALAISLLRKRRAWKIAALLPLFLMGGIFILTITAFLGNSGLWPIVLIFTAPFTIAYLAVLLSVHGIYMLYLKLSGTK